MKKRRLKRWVKTLIAIIIIYAIGLLFSFIWSSRVKTFDANMEKCGSNYCERN